MSTDHVAAALALVSQLKELMGANQFAKAQELLAPIKIALVQFATPQDDATKLRQSLLAREALELSALLSVELKQTDAFERNMAQLKPYYFDPSVPLPSSERQFPILGLHLVSLLAHNRIAEFHTELELIPLEAHEQNPYVRYARELEQHFMEGSYGKVLRAAAQVPLPYYATFTQKLTTTVRGKIADCCERAYDALPVASFASMLSIQPAELQGMCAAEKRAWTFAEGAVTFAKSAGNSLDIPSAQVIDDMLAYANELERIV